MKETSQLKIARTENKMSIERKIGFHENIAANANAMANMNLDSEPVFNLLASGFQPFAHFRSDDNIYGGDIQGDTAILLPERWE